MNKQDLLEKINEAFFFERKYEMNEISDLNEKYPDHEGNQVARFFSNKSNKDISLDSLMNDYECDHTVCLTFMKPEPSSYFLGAYMYIAISEDDAAQDIRVYLIGLLSGEIVSSELFGNWFKVFRESLDSFQKSAILGFINYLEENYFDILFSSDFDACKKLYLQ